MANFYFLILAIMELFPAISDSQYALLMPLTLVVGVSMIKDLYEDCKRSGEDNKENRRKFEIAPRGKSAF
jgi:adenosinetriphosphatase/phospholipid-translocating ATPase